MLKPEHKVALYMEGHLFSDYGKMGFGVLRYLKNPIVAVIDHENSGTTIDELLSIPSKTPIVPNLKAAIDLQADVLILGIAPSGGKIPQDWYPIIEQALQAGMSIVNGLHDLLNARFQHAIVHPDKQWIWDVRVPQFTPNIATAQAFALPNKRILFVGTDMAAGKMTAALELYGWSQKNNIKAGFVATGQIGITITGAGIPLDAFKVDHACGAVEEAVLAQKEADWIFIEGQGSLLHPGSTATLPLMRGSCPTHLILCHRADMEHLRHPTAIRIPALKPFVALNEALASVCGTFGAPKVVGIALNTMKLSEAEARAICAQVSEETGIPATDVVRFGAEVLAQAIQKA
jgi:uncharacterized NAD-dependent epimerase/dehydratase family protein